jgi:uncharacterized protein with GYD domain
MPTYVLLTNLAAPGLERLHKSPERIMEVNEELGQWGCRLIAQYALLGPYDFLNIIEAPDNETMAHLSIDLGARGTATHLTMPAVATDELAKRLGGKIQLTG